MIDPIDTVRVEGPEMLKIQSQYTLLQTTQFLSQNLIFGKIQFLTQKMHCKVKLGYKIEVFGQKLDFRNSVL